MKAHKIRNLLLITTEGIWDGSPIFQPAGTDKLERSHLPVPSFKPISVNPIDPSVQDSSLWDDTGVLYISENTFGKYSYDSIQPYLLSGISALVNLATDKENCEQVNLFKHSMFNWVDIIYPIEQFF